MSNIIMRLLPLVLICLVCGSAAAQQADRPPNLNLGDAVVTGFSGILPPDPAQQRPRGKSAIDLTFINPDGPSARVVDLARPGYVWDGRLFMAPKKFDALAKDVGQVFGVALDDQPQPNIYVAATSIFGLHIIARGRDGLPERRKKGGPGAGWMKGQFGLDLQGGPGGIYRIDGLTGVITLLANVTLDGVPNPGPGLGNLAYDSAHRQLFVSDLYTGMIHRIDLDGRDLGSYDHGVSGRSAAGSPPLPFNPRLRPNIASDRFDSENPSTWGFAPPGRQVWGLAVNDGRLYYSVSAGPQIWSVGIQSDGSLATDPRWELDVPAQSGPIPVSDIAFSPQGAMILAQRALIAGSYDYSAFTRPGEPQVLRFSLKAPNAPPSPGRWTPTPDEYAVGLAGNYRNTNGGVALGYGYGPDGTLDTTSACAAAVWTTGQNLRNNPALRSQLEPGGPLLVEGLQGSPADMLRPANAAPAASYFIDYDDKFDDARASGHMGSVRILTRPCAAPLAYVSGPTSPASPAAGGGGGGGVRPPPPPPPNVCIAPGLPPGLPTSLSLPPCTQPGQAVTLDLSTVTYPYPPPGQDPNWAVTPFGPQGHSTSNLPAWNVLPNNWIQPQQSYAVQYNNPVQPYVYTRSFNLICAPESYRSLKLSGHFGCDNTGIPALNGNPLPPGSGPSCYHNPPVPVGGIPFSHIGPSFFVQGLNSLTVTVQNTPPGGPTGLSVVAQLEAECGTDCLCKSIDLTIGKENTPQGGSGTSFNLWVTNVGVPITFPVGGLTVTDVIPAGMTVTSITSPNWTCTPTSLVGPGTLTCTYNLAGSLATGAQLPGSIIVNYTTTGPGPFTNCATISAGAVVGVDTNSANNTACVTVTPSPGSLSVTKVVAPDPRGIGSTLTFPMTVTCTAPPTTYSLNVLGNTSTPPINVPVGRVCSVTETLPALPPGCTWLPPVYTPASVTIATGLNHLQVTNAYRCREQSGSLIVKKEVIYVGPATLPSQIYPVTVNCGGTITTLGLVDGVPQTVSNITLNTSCTVVEGPVPTPPNVCPPNTTPVWTTAYIPPSPLTITGPGITELVRNTLVCRPIPIQVSTCPPPMVPGPVAGQCICPLNTVRKGKECVSQRACPEGTVKRGSRCVEPVVCRAPAKLNRRGVCECPPDMVAKGKGCVARERRQLNLPDVINIPGRFGPGGGGRREGPTGGGGGREGPAGGGGSPGGSPGRR